MKRNMILIILAFILLQILAVCDPDEEFNGEVRMAKSSQLELLASGERLSADPDKMSEISVYNGMQVKVTNKDNDDYALYTFYEDRQENTENILRIAKIGRDRLGQTSTPITVEVSNEIVHPTMTESQAERNGGFIERLSETSITHNSLVILAPHGGMIEYRTDDQAERVYDALASKSRDVSAWRAKGWKPGGGAYSTWHITSTEIDPRSFPRLYEISRRDFSYGVAFHGWSEDYIAIGGLANNVLKNELKRAIEMNLEGTSCSSVSVVVDPSSGQSEENIVNWVCSNNGIQIEQPYTVRDGCWKEVADAVSSVFNDKLPKGIKDGDRMDDSSGYSRTNEYMDSEAARKASCPAGSVHTYCSSPDSCVDCSGNCYLPGRYCSPVGDLICSRGKWDLASDSSTSDRPDIQIVTQAVDSDTNRAYYSYNSAGQQVFQIKVLVIGPDKFDVRSVHYELHPTFSPPEYTSRDSYNDFELELWTWGAFDMPITVTMKDGRTYEYDYYFTFGDQLRDAQRRGVPFVQVR